MDLGNSSMLVSVLVHGLGMFRVIVLVADGHTVASAQQLAQKTTALELEVAIIIVVTVVAGRIDEVVNKAFVDGRVAVVVDSVDILAPGVVELVGDVVFVTDQRATCQA